MVLTETLITDQSVRWEWHKWRLSYLKNKKLSFKVKYSKLSFECGTILKNLTALPLLAKVCIDLGTRLLEILPAYCLKSTYLSNFRMGSKRGGRHQQGVLFRWWWMQGYATALSSKLLILAKDSWTSLVDRRRRESLTNKKCGRFSFVDGRSISRSVIMAYFIIFHATWDPSLYCL